MQRWQRPHQWLQALHDTLPNRKLVPLQLSHHPTHSLQNQAWECLWNDTESHAISWHRLYPKMNTGTRRRPAWSSIVCDNVLHCGMLAFRDCYIWRLPTTTTTESGQLQRLELDFTDLSRTLPFAATATTVSSSSLLNFQLISVALSGSIPIEIATILTFDASRCEFYTTQWYPSDRIGTIDQSYAFRRSRFDASYGNSTHGTWNIVSFVVLGCFVIHRFFVWDTSFWEMVVHTDALECGGFASIDWDNPHTIGTTCSIATLGL